MCGMDCSQPRARRITNPSRNQRAAYLGNSVSGICVCIYTHVCVCARVCDGPGEGGGRGVGEV